MRQWDDHGRVTTQTDGSALRQVLAASTATVLSLEDVGGEWAAVERWARLAPVVVVTRGKEGATVFVRGQGARDYAAPAQTETDPTGAGDIFAAAFFIHHYETGDAWAAARVANQIASVSVTREGLAGVPTTEEVGLARMKGEGSWSNPFGPHKKSPHTSQ
jgi:sugar/nucleoside kinase (ribokinase family)